MAPVAQGSPINIWHHFTKLTRLDDWHRYIHIKHCDKLYLLVRNTLI